MYLMRWRSLIMKAGLAFLLVITFCEAKSENLSGIPAHTLAAQTGAAHFEERLEEIQPQLPHRLHKRSSNEDDLDYEVYQGVVGRPGIDFPILPRIPQTTFSCRTFGNGYFADLETDCQVFHICEEGRKISFLCPNGTIFQQAELTCDWWFKVNCAGSPGLYAESSEMLSRAQNRAKQRTQIAKNEFYSAERDYSNERGNGYKNQYPVKSGNRNKSTQDGRSAKKPLNRRIDSDELTSVENFDFEDISANRRESNERSTGSPRSNKSGKKSRYDASLESQDVAESSSFFGNNNGRNFNNKNGNRLRNGYVYDDPSNEKIEKNNNRTDNGESRNGNSVKSRGNERGRQKFEDNGETRNPGKLASDNETNRGQNPRGKSQNRTENKPALIHTVEKVKKYFDQENNAHIGNSGTYTTTRKFETSRTTPYYTPTIPVLGGKVTKPILPEIKATTPKYIETTTNKYFGNLGFSFTTSNPQYETETTLPALNRQTSTPRQFVIGLRGNNVQNYNRITNDHAKDTTVNYRGNNKASVTTYSPPTNTKYLGGPTYLPKTTTESSYTTSTSGPTYLPKSTTSGPTYLPKVTKTYRPSSAGPTYLPKSSNRPTKPQNSISTHVKDMIKSLNDLNVDTKDLDNEVNKFIGKSSRTGLEILPSSGPETLASLASYFASDDEKLPASFSTKTNGNGGTASQISLTASLTTEKTGTTVNVINNIQSGLLTNKTVGNYDQLFGLKTNIKTTAASLPDILSPEFIPRSQDDNDLEGQHSNGPLGDSIGKLETRKIAKVFTNALSAYLEDPIQFKRVLNEVRPTEPPNSEELFVTGAPATWRRPTKKENKNVNQISTHNSRIITTATTPLATEDLEVLDFSDVTVKNNGSFGFKQSFTTTTQSPLKSKDRGTVSQFSITKTTTTKPNRFTTTTPPHHIAAEINKVLATSTLKPLSLAVDLLAPEYDGKLTTRTRPLETFTNLPLLSIDLLPPIGKPNLKVNIPPPILDEDDDTLQRAQSQSFVASRNNQLAKEQKSIRIGKITKQPNGHFITEKYKNNPTTTTEIPDFIKTTQNPWTHLAQTVYLDPLTINDGLMNKYKTTTSSPFTYIPKSTTTPTYKTTAMPRDRLHINLDSSLSSRNAASSRAPKTKISQLNLSEDLLPPRDGMKRIAVKMFGGLNETQADHLLNVMKKAETNQVVRRLILLLIQTCDEDYSKRVEQSRQALLNALIGMDSKYEFDEEVEVIKLKPRRQKSIGSSRRNRIETTTLKIPVTTYRRRSLNLVSSRGTTTTNAPQTTTDYLSHSTTGRPEDTTRFEIRVEDLDDDFMSTSTVEPDQIYSTAPTSTNFPETTTWFSSRTTLAGRTTTDYPLITTLKPIMSSKANSRRKPKDLEGFLSQESIGNQNISHKNSDERALELLKSLYSLASKFGRR